ncbi:unnamed protein product [Peronospora destructor]|uniref:Uncharacterized protein n=1 Tax=Peronospora destructor TaxID=86335 RepID=A0AAV0TN00_9STRA|nr:unnamed protein product [Peronospora destructor]
MMEASSGVPSVCVRELHSHQGPINAIRFNSKGTYVMTCGQDKTVKLWNPHRDEAEKPNEALLVKTYEGRHGYDVRDVTIARDNSKFASCGRDRDIFMWDVSTAQVVRKFEYQQTLVPMTKTIRAWDIRARNAYMPIPSSR